MTHYKKHISIKELIINTYKNSDTNIPDRYLYKLNTLEYGCRYLQILI